MVDLLDEIKDDIKQERVGKLWKRYGTIIVSLAIAIVVGTTGKVWWDDHKNTKEQAFALQYYQALRQIERGNFEQSQSSLAELSKSDTAGYSVFAAFTVAQQHIAQGNVDAALTSYRELANNDAADSVLKDLATLLLTYYRIEHGKGNEQAILADLEHLTQAGNPWYFSGVELKAVYALQKNDVEKSYALFNELDKDSQTPVELRRISKEVLKALVGQYPYLATKEQKNEDNG